MTSRTPDLRSPAQKLVDIHFKHHPIIPWLKPIPYCPVCRGTGVVESLRGAYKGKTLRHSSPCGWCDRGEEIRNMHPENP